LAYHSPVPLNDKSSQVESHDGLYHFLYHFRNPMPDLTWPPMRIGRSDAFFHVSDFGATGYSLIPGAVALTGRIVVWAPSGAVLKQENDAGRLNFSPSDFLDLVDAGKVQVAAREDWIISNKRQTGHWADAPWMTGFDEILRQWFIKDYNKPEIQTRRVIGLSRGGGQQFAKEAMHESDILNRVGGFLSQNKIPAHLVQKAKLNEANDKETGLTGLEYIKYFVMSSAYNHIEAQQNTYCPIAVSNKDHFLSYQNLIRNPSTLFVHGSQARTELGVDLFENEHVEELMEFIHFLMTHSDMKSLIKFLEKPKDRGNLMVDVFTNNSPLVLLQADLAETADALSLKSYWPHKDIPNKPSAKGFYRLAQLLSNAVAVATNAVPATLRLPELRALQTLGVTEIEKYRGHWAFLLMGYKKVRKRNIHTALELINEFRSQRKLVK
jgi:hypothetical protein